MAIGQLEIARHERDGVVSRPETAAIPVPLALKASLRHARLHGGRLTDRTGSHVRHVERDSAYCSLPWLHDRLAMFRLSAGLQERAEALASSCRVSGLRVRVHPSLLLFDLVGTIGPDGPFGNSKHARDADQPPGRGQDAHHGPGDGKPEL